MRVQEWFEVWEAEPGIVVIEESLHAERVKSYLIIGDHRAALIDTGMGVGDIAAVVRDLTDKPVTVLLSHAHWDHIGGNTGFSDLHIHPAEADRLPAGYPNDRMQRWFAPEQLSGPLPAGLSVDSLIIPPSTATGFLHEGDIIDLGGRTLEVWHLPGHSPGGLVFIDRANGVLFSTDLAYQGYLYAYRGDDLAIYRASLDRLATLTPDLRVVYPSHNTTPISPALMPRLAYLLGEVTDGTREPDEWRGNLAVYGDGDIGVYLFPGH
jgi:glyoxylase-like metal-dependent hydrolase (beta-lactamase superfamily II)